MKEEFKTELGQSVIDPNTTKPVKGSAAGLMPRVSIQSADQNPSSGLLGALWRSPEQCHQISVRDRQTKKFRNIVVKDAVEAAKLAQEHSKAGSDAYFACAEYETPNNRTAANVSGSYGFWLDIDCGEDKATAGKGYLTVEEAEEAIKRFCKDTGLPAPTYIVNSGNGLHVYWVLDRAINPEIWKAYAEKLKALTKTLAFLVDGSRTADIASVLRVPGTLNYKNNPPRPVTIKYASAELIDQNSMLNAIDSAHDKLCRQPLIPTTSNRDMSECGLPDLTELASALASLDPDCDEATWKLNRLAPLARAAVAYPELSS